MFNIETSVVDRIANSLSDAEILAISALLFGLVGGMVAFLANQFWFRGIVTLTGLEGARR